MTTLTPIDARTLNDRIRDGRATLIDIREDDEYAREHIPGAISLPLSRLEAGHLKIEPGKDAVFHCKSGMRTGANCTRLSGSIDGEAFMLAGGLEAWKQAGMQVQTNDKAPLEMNRQVQITVGSLLVLGIALTILVNPVFLLVPALLGCGLLFAGMTGWCGMAHLLALAPWNRARPL